MSIPDTCKFCGSEAFKISDLVLDIYPQLSAVIKRSSGYPRVHCSWVPRPENCKWDLFIGCHFPLGESNRHITVRHEFDSRDIEFKRGDEIVNSLRILIEEAVEELAAFDERFARLVEVGEI